MEAGIDGLDSDLFRPGRVVAILPNGGEKVRESIHPQKSLALWNVVLT